MTKTLESLRNGKEFVEYARKSGAQVRNGKGSHCIVSTANGSCVVPLHPGDLGKGLRCKIIKTFAAIGLALMPLIYLLSEF
jgi:predicted RNA binding protein YcfA (HicA-like mRNA interferase family)